jgi:hypothetical protein
VELHHLELMPVGEPAMFHIQVTDNNLSLVFTKNVNFLSAFRWTLQTMLSWLYQFRVPEPTYL